MDERSEIQERHFVEQVGLLYQEMGGPPIWGRILGRLLVCDPPHQSLTELATYLESSKSAVSTATRQLHTARIIERVPVPGQRGTFWRLRENVWSGLMRRRIHFLTLMRDTAKQGLEVLADAPPERRRRLDEFHAFYAFMEQQIPKLIDDWDKEHG